MIGRVVWFDIKKGFGFVHSDQLDADVFVHYSKIMAPDGEFRVLEEGETVEFEVFYSARQDGSQKPQAKNVKIVETEDAYIRKDQSENIRRCV